MGGQPGLGPRHGGEFPGLSGQDIEIALAQAMVEEYHTLMHINAHAVTGRKRQAALPDAELHIARVQQRLRDRASDRRERRLTTLAFATVAEFSINAYLDLCAEDPDPR